jgi:hypothetical protein
VGVKIADKSKLLTGIGVKNSQVAELVDAKEVS